MSEKDFSYASDALSHSLSNPLSQAVLKDWQQLSDLYQQTRAEFLRLGHCHEALVIPTPGPDRRVMLTDLVCIHSENRRTRIHLADGDSFLTSTTFSLEIAETQLAPWPQFQRLTDRYLINIHRLSQTHSHPERRRDYELVMDSGLCVSLPESRKPRLLKLLGESSLRKVKSLKAHGGRGVYLDNIRPFNKDLRLMSKEELNTHFLHPRTGNFETSEFLSNYIWEYARLLKQGKRPPIEGNIRTFWYVLKPTLARAVPLEGEKQYYQMLEAFQRLIVRYGMLKFRDFSFSDEGQRFYVPGSKRINVLLVAEKKGHFRRLQSLQEEYGLTIVALGGMPSLLNSEYFASNLAPKLAKKPLHIISIVDYNPAGALILKAFLAQLQHEGLSTPESIQHLVVPEHFDPEELQAISEPVPMNSKADRTKARRWIEAGGGINGEPRGIESDALVLYRDRLKGFLQKALDKTERPAALASSLQPPTPESPPKYTPESLHTEEDLLVF